LRGGISLTLSDSVISNDLIELNVIAIGQPAELTDLA
jgi:hypothetical protein